MRFTTGLFVLAAVAALAAPDIAAATPSAANDARVTLRPASDPPLLDCTSAIPIGCGDSVGGSNIGTPSNAATYSCASHIDMGGGEVVYELTLPGPQYWILEVVLERDLNEEVYVFLLASCDEGDCLEFGDTYYYTRPVPPGTYYIVVDGAEDGFGGYDECEYTLHVNCVPLDPPTEECCPLVSECVVFDFTSSNPGFTTLSCDGFAVWDWGTGPWWEDVDCDDSTAVYALSTVPDDHYPQYAGEAAVIGPVQVTAGCSCLELCHTYIIRETSDGGNVKVSTDGGTSWELVHPARLYDSQSHEACLCLPEELVFGRDGRPFFRDCFDLSAYIGSEVHIGFFFGSIISSPTWGWYIFWAKLGTDKTPVEPSSWGTIKAMYR